MKNLIPRTSYKVPYFTAVADKEGKYKANRILSEAQIIKAAKAILKSRVAQLKNSVSSPNEVRDLLITYMSEYKNEVFTCVFMDNRHQVISMEELFHGTIDSASVYPRVIAQRALELNSAAIIIAHNHPSGIPTPSFTDEQITTKIKDTMSLLDIRLLDHFIVGGGNSFSFAEQGYL